MIAVSTSPINLSMLRQYNTWYIICDGNWSNPAIWISNGTKKHALPQAGDNVYIDNNVALDISVTINNITVNGKLSSLLNNLTLNVNGDLQTTGAIDFTGTNIDLILNGYNNYVSSFTAGNSIVTYNAPMDQNVMPLTYMHVKIYNTGIKYLTANTIINGDLNINDFQPYDAFLECGNYDLTVGGNFSATANGGNGNGNFAKSGPGTLLFIGNCTIDARPTFSSSITIAEFRGGFSGGGFGGSININCPVIFSTNSQTLQLSGTYFNNTVQIAGTITVTNNSSSIYFSGAINGDNVNSTFTNNGFLGLSSSILPMKIGIFNWMATTSSTVDYSFDGNYTLPFTTYQNLNIHGTGVKTLLADTTINNNLTINDFQAYNAQLDCSSYNLTINGNTSITGTGTGGSLDAALLKSGAGRILFIGSVNWNTGNIAYNPNVTLEFRGGALLGPFGPSGGIMNATMNFTTNSQTISINALNLFGNINISGGITLTSLGSETGEIFGVINGATSLDTFKNTGTLYYNNTNEPMVTGILDTSSTNNVFIYSATTGNQDIKANTYDTLSLGSVIYGGGGTKNLLGNISVNTYSLYPPTTLNSNGFTIINLNP